MLYTKICTKCKKEKSLSEFSKNRAECKECAVEIRRLYYLGIKDTDKYKQKNRLGVKKARQKIRDYINTIKQNQKCLYCQESDIRCLDFHHNDPNIKTEAVSKMIRTASLLNVQKEIEKCIIVCANCHRKIHFKDK